MEPTPWCQRSRKKVQIAKSTTTGRRDCCRSVVRRLLASSGLGVRLLCSKLFGEDLGLFLICLFGRLEIVTCILYFSES